MLSQLARQAGFKVLAIDCFADVDTRDSALEYCQVPSLALTDIKTTIDYLVEKYSVAYAVNGSGFERFVDSLDYLHRRLTLFGNSGSTYQALQNKPDFFQRLDDLKIKYPEVSFSVPVQTDNWLYKPFFHEGGQGIGFVRPGYENSPCHYYQRYLNGQAGSILFLADGKRSEIIGFNRQWTERQSNAEYFLFSGVINHFELSSGHYRLILAWLKQLVPVYALTGINCLDFIIYQDQCYVLEINPRPSASMQLYNRDIFTALIKACQGQLTKLRPVSTVYSAYQIIYAKSAIKIPYNMRWPKWCADIPNSNVLIGAGQPVCSIIAQDNKPQQVFKLLINRQHCIKNQLRQGKKDYGILGKC